ncbi:MAG: lipid droplet-associated protein, partial [Pseudonocardiaceae bacterium]
IGSVTEAGLTTMSHLPLPVRVAVGLALTAVEQARKLPEQLAELPVTAASRAVQAGMRVQQRVTELAIKGDEVFSLFRPVEDTPPWATFDEDEKPQRPEADSATVPAPGSVPVAREFDEADVAQALTPPHATATTAKPDANPSTSVLNGYEALSLAQLRGKLRGLSLPQLMEMLEYEHVHQDRPAFVTLLSNRIATVRSQ